MMQCKEVYYVYYVKIGTNSVTFITNHEAAFITVCAPENDCPVVVGVTPPTSLTDSAGIHSVTSTFTAGAAYYLRVLKYRVIPLHTSGQF